MSSSGDWYVLYTRARNEKKVAQRLHPHYEVYCPLVTTVRQWSDRKKKVSEPLFKSYVFVRVSETGRQEVLKTPGVVCYVYWLGKPARVREEEIDAIKRFTEETESADVLSIEYNDTVQIDWGLFKGQEGKFLARQGDHLILLVESLGQLVKAEVPVRYAKKAG